MDAKERRIKRKEEQEAEYRPDEGDGIFPFTARQKREIKTLRRQMQDDGMLCQGQFYLSDGVYVSVEEVYIMGIF